MYIYTIGHSNHKWETFSELLAIGGIELLVDVRSRPVSRFAPFSNKSRLPDLLKEIGIGYKFMGDSLGGRPDNPSLYDENGKPDYRKMAVSETFQSGLEQLVDLADEAVTVMMCSEGDPVECHRRLLIGAALAERGIGMLHIRRDGTLIGEEDLGGSQGKLDL